MKMMTCRALLALFAIGLCSEILAVEKPDYPNISMVGPSHSKNPVNRDEYVIPVVEGPFISYEGQRIPSTGVVDYVNSLLKVKHASSIGVHAREGVRYGDLVRALDLLRATNARDIGVSLVELPLGREP
jgi:biopolymer transport protein ExbD